MNKYNNYYGWEIAKFYDLITGSGYYDYERLVTIIKSIVDDRRRILELGIGTGNMAIPLAKQGFEVDGIDTSEPMLNIAREKIVGGGPEIGLYRQDCAELNLPSEYDVVLSHGGVPVYIRGKEGMIFESYLPTLERNYKALQNVFDHLDENGRFIVNIQNDHEDRETLALGDHLFYWSSIEYSGDFIRKTHYVTRGDETLVEQAFDIRRFSKETIDDVLDQIGFRVLGEDKTGSFYVMKVK